MTDFKQVQEALAAGADPAMLCMTCPWDRLCIVPPQMTSGQVEAQIKKARDEDEQRFRRDQAAGKSGAFPIGSLMTAIMVGGKDTAAQICPVFALRLRGPEGRELADSIRQSMQSWSDESGAS